MSGSENASSLTGRCGRDHWESLINPVLRIAVSPTSAAEANGVAVGAQELEDFVSETIRDLSANTRSIAVQTSDLSTTSIAIEKGRKSTTGRMLEDSVTLQESENDDWSCFKPMCGQVRLRNVTTQRRQSMKIWTTSDAGDQYGTFSQNANNVVTTQPRGTGSGITGGSIASNNSVIVDMDEDCEESLPQDRAEMIDRSRFAATLHYMNKLCWSPCGIEKGDEEAGICALTKKCLRGALSCSSILQSLRMLKHYIFNFLGEAGNVGNYVEMVFFAMRLVSKLNFLHVMTLRQPKVLRVVDCIREVQQERENVTKKKAKRRLFGILLVANSVISVAARTVFGAYELGTHLGLETIIYGRALTTGRSIMAWNPFTYGNDTERITQEYVNHMGSSAIGLAAAGLSLNYCGWGQDQLVADLLLSIAMDLYEEMAAFVETINKKGADAAETPDEKKAKLRWLMALRKLADSINQAYGMVLILTHADNLLFLAETILQQANLDMQLSVIFRTMGCIKVVITLVYALKASMLNKPIRNWLNKNKDMSPFVEENGDEISVSDIIELMEKKPIGIGLPGTMIDAGFIKQFGTATASIFLFLATLQDRKSNCQCSCICKDN